MFDAGEIAFAWAKASGIVGKTFLGPRGATLLSVSRLSELDRLLFPDSPADLPERELSVVLERRIAERAVSRTLRIVSAFSSPPSAVKRLVSAFEYEAFSRLLAASVSGERNPPLVPDLGPYRTLRSEAYPDLAGMTEGTEFAWAAEAIAGGTTLLDVETELDRRYYAALWNDVAALPSGESQAFQRLLAEEISLKNIVCALRLRVYYGMVGDELRRRLIDVPAYGGSLADEALATESYALDRFEDWKKWKRRYLLGDAAVGDSWGIDPRIVQNAAAGRLYRLARSLFRANPCSLGAIACFARLVLFEEDLLTSVAEGLALGIVPKDAIASLGVGV